MKICIVDSRISSEEELNLKKLSLKILKVPAFNTLYDAIKCHTDILLHPVNNDTILVHKDMPLNFINELKNLGFTVILSKNCLGNKYPQDIILNAISLPNLFIHNLKYTDENLLNLVKDKKNIHVNQGYSKCSTAILGNNAFITSDVPMFQALEKEGLKGLFLPPGDIELPGLNYGFIGGCTGFLSDKEILFTGNLNFYKFGEEVKSFLSKLNMTPIYLRNGPLIDRGSLFILTIPN